MPDKQTRVVNLFAGPGTGKSTNAALVFGKLKVRGINAELVHEYAKDLTWEERTELLGQQSYIMAKQQRHIERVQGKVEIIVTDSPLPFSLVYKGRDYTEGLGLHIMETFARWQNLNIFLRRDNDHHPYVEVGRSQTREEAEEIDLAILQLLHEWQIPFVEVPILQGEETAAAITDLVLQQIGHETAPTTLTHPVTFRTVTKELEYQRRD